MGGGGHCQKQCGGAASKCCGSATLVRNELGYYGIKDARCKNYVYENCMLLDKWNTFQCTGMHSAQCAKPDVYRRCMLQGRVCI
jgi:hypothetical protein